MFQDFNEFFGWYIGKVREQVPGIDDIPADESNIIHKMLKPLTNKQVDELNLDIRTIIKFPTKIALVYQEYHTFASWFNPQKKRFEILYPTITIWLKEYPELIKEGIRHELGHILNGDSFVKTEPKHGQCTNIAMDARINMHLSYKILGYLVRCLHFKNDPIHDTFVKPEEYYPLISLPVVAGGYNWHTAHEQYHLFNEGGGKDGENGNGKQNGDATTDPGPFGGEEPGTDNPGEDGDEDGKNGDGKDGKGKKPGKPGTSNNRQNKSVLKDIEKAIESLNRIKQA